MIRVLIVDDSRAMQQIVRRVLESAGHSDIETKLASDGLEALDVARYWEPDLILSDWHMPEMTGMELLTAINREMLDIKVGFVTTETSAARILEATEAGVQFIVNKPFDMATFHRAVLPVLESVRAGAGALHDHPDDDELLSDSVEHEIAEFTGSDHEPPNANGVILPTVEQLEATVNGVARGEVFMEAVERISFTPASLPCVLALLSDPTSGHVRAVGILDLPAACILGGVFGGQGEDYVCDAIQKRTISPLLLTGCEGILKVVSETIGIVSEDVTVALHLSRANIVQQIFPKLESLLETPADERVDCDLAAVGYGQGSMTIVTSR